MKKDKIFFLSIILMILISINVHATLDIKEKNNQYFNQKILNLNDDQPYMGHIKIYIVEPESRWDMANRKPYHFAVLDFAYEENLTIDYLDTYTKTISWEGDISQDNVMVIAAIFNPEINKGYSLPPAKNLFNAHYVDAAAGAEPGETNFNTVNENFTHTVFAEEGTATWCQYCPDMADRLYDVYQSNDYPFYFVALVSDENQDALNRLLYDYNIYGYPTSYFDGGRRVLIGSGIDESSFRSRIEYAGSKDVHELNLSLNVQWLGNGNIEINISVTNNEEITNNPPETPMISGTSSGKAGNEYEYTITTNDPEGNSIYYYIEWFDGCPGVDWKGPYSSGEKVKITNTWNEQGTYIIRVKAMDIYGSESDWAEFEVKMPINKIQRYSLLKHFMELISNLFK